jgi:hypothetical protein
MAYFGQFLRFFSFKATSKPECGHSAVAHAVLAQHLATVPEFLDDGG